MRAFLPKGPANQERGSFRRLAALRLARLRLTPHLPQWLGLLPRHEHQLIPSGPVTCSGHPPLKTLHLTRSLHVCAAHVLHRCAPDDSGVSHWSPERPWMRGRRMHSLGTRCPKAGIQTPAADSSRHGPPLVPRLHAGPQGLWETGAPR